MRVALTCHGDPKGELGWIVAPAGEPIHIGIDYAAHERDLRDAEYAASIPGWFKSCAIPVTYGNDEDLTPYFLLPSRRFAPYRVTIIARSASSGIARAFGTITIVPPWSRLAGATLSLALAGVAVLLVWVYLHLPPTHWADVFEWVKPTSIGTVAFAAYVALRRERTLPLLGIVHDVRVSGALLAGAVLMVAFGPTSFVARVSNETQAKISLRTSSLGPALELEPHANGLVWVGRSKEETLGRMLGERKDDYCFDPGEQGCPRRPKTPERDSLEALLRIPSVSIACKNTKVDIAGKKIDQPRNQDCSPKKKGDIIEVDAKDLEKGTNGIVRLLSTTTGKELKNNGTLTFSAGNSGSTFAVRMVSEGNISEVNAENLSEKHKLVSPVDPTVPLRLEVHRARVHRDMFLGSLLCRFAAGSKNRKAEVLETSGARLEFLRFTNRNTTFSEWQSHRPEREGTAVWCSSELAQDAQADVIVEMGLAPEWYPHQKWRVSLKDTRAREVEVYLSNGAYLGTAPCDASGENPLVRPIQIVDVPRRTTVSRLVLNHKSVWIRAEQADDSFREWLFLCKSGSELKEAHDLYLSSGEMARAIPRTSGTMKYRAKKGEVCAFEDNTDPPRVRKQAPDASCRKPAEAWLKSKEKHLRAHRCEPDLVRICPR